MDTVTNSRYCVDETSILTTGAFVICSFLWTSVLIVCLPKALCRRFPTLKSVLRSPDLIRDVGVIHDFQFPIMCLTITCIPARCTLCRHFPTLSVLRRHPSPSRQQFDGLLAIAEAVGIVLEVDNSKKLAASLDSAIREDDPYFNKLLRILSTRCVCALVRVCCSCSTVRCTHRHPAYPVSVPVRQPINKNIQ